MADPNTDENLGIIIYELIEDGDLETLTDIVNANPNLNLSYFPGILYSPRKLLTPLAHAASRVRTTIFNFLLSQQMHRRVDLNVIIPHENIRTNLLGFLVMDKQDIPFHHSPHDPRDYMLSYAIKLLLHVVKQRAPMRLFIPDSSIEKQPILLIFRHFESVVAWSQYHAQQLGDGREDNVSLAFQQKIEQMQHLIRSMCYYYVRFSTQEDANMLMDIFFGKDILPDALRQQNVLGEIIHRLMQDVQPTGHFQFTDKFDLDRFIYNKYTRQIFETLETDRTNRNFALASSQYRNLASPLSALSVPLLQYISRHSLRDNLRGITVGDCDVCFETADLHKVCDRGPDGHRLCGNCHERFILDRNLKCPQCRGPLGGS